MRAFQDGHGAVALDERADGRGAVALDLLDCACQEARGLAGVGRDDDLLSGGGWKGGLLAGVPLGQHVERVGVQHEAPSAAREEPREKQLGVGRDAESHADRRDVGLGRDARGRALEERGLGEEGAGGDARCVGHHELDESGAGGDDGRVHEVRAAADHGHHAGCSLVKVWRALGERPCYCWR